MQDWETYFEIWATPKERKLKACKAFQPKPVRLTKKHTVISKSETTKHYMVLLWSNSLTDIWIVYLTSEELQPFRSYYRNPNNNFLPMKFLLSTQRITEVKGVKCNFKKQNCKHCGDLLFFPKISCWTSYSL